MKKKNLEKIREIAARKTQVGREGRCHHHLDGDKMRELDSSSLRLATYVTDRFEYLTEKEVADAIMNIELMHQEIASFNKRSNDCSDGFHNNEEEEIMKEEQGHEDKMEELIGRMLKLSIFKDVKESEEMTISEDGNIKKRPTVGLQNLTMESEGNKQKRPKKSGSDLEEIEAEIGKLMLGGGAGEANEGLEPKRSI